MKVNVLVENLNRVMGVVLKGISSKVQLPILSNLLIRATSEGLELITTDLEISFVGKIGAKVEEDGEILIPGKTLADLLATIEVGTVELSTEKNVLKIQGQGVQMELAGLGVEEYPVVPRFPGKGVVFDLAKLTMVAERLLISAAKDDSRPVLNGVLWLLEKGKMTMVATDGYRLSMDEFEVKNEDEFKMVVPLRVMQEIVRSAANEAGKLEMCFEEEKQQVIFKVGSMEISSRLIAGEFPPFRQIIPKEYRMKVTAERESWLKAVRRASIFARGNANIVNLKVSENLLEVSAMSAEVGKSADQLEVEIEGEEIQAAFNGKYLTEYLGGVKGEKIVWESEGELRPGVFRVEGETGIHIIMPIRQNS